LFYNTSFPQQHWEYPIKPFTREWSNLKNLEEIRAVQQIPEPTLKTMSTEELFKAWIDLPGRIEILSYSTLQQGFEMNVKHFNVLDELLHRKDAGKIIIKEYFKSKPIDVNNAITGRQKGKFISDLGFIELLLSQGIILGSITHNDVKELFKKIVNNIEQKQVLSIKDRFWLETGIVLAGRLLEYANISNFKEKLQINKELKQSLDAGEINSKEIFEILYNIIKNIHME
jgi:hypothetical protein